MRECRISVWGRRGCRFRACGWANADLVPGRGVNARSVARGEFRFTGLGSRAKGVGGHADLVAGGNDRANAGFVAEGQMQT